MHQSKASELILFLTEALKLRVTVDGEVAGMSVYRLDASDWRIRLSSNTPLIDTCPVSKENISSLELLDKVTDVVVQEHLQNSIFIIVIPGHDEQIRREVHRWRHQSILLDDQDITDIIGARNPLDSIIAKILQQLPLSVLSPYQFGSPVTGTSFYGRQHEMNLILSNPETAFTITGIRRIGKTSLLLELQRILKMIRKTESFFFDCSQFRNSGDFLNFLVLELGGPRELQQMQRQNLFFLQRFFELMAKKYGGPPVLLLDEADQLLQLDSKSDYEIFKILRGLSLPQFARHN